MSDYINLPGYASPENLWHKNAKLLLGKNVIVEEKIDGSQLTFGRMQDGELHCRSKGKQLDLEDVDKLFAPVVNALQKIAEKLPRGVIFRAEAVTRNRHNVLNYGRVPMHFLVVYDVQSLDGWLDPACKRKLCWSLDLEVVEFDSIRLFHEYGELEAYLDLPSMLGGPREGIVIKPFDYVPLDPYTNMPVMAKMVREEFREKHKVAGNPNGTPGPKHIIERLVSEFATEARWQKAVQHLQERGELEGEMLDVRALMLEVAADVAKEEETYIRCMLWEWAWPQVKRQVAKGLPEWYKERLLKQ